MAIQIDKAGQLQRGAQAAGASLAQLGTGVADLLDPNRGLKQQVKEMLATDPTKAQALARSARKNDKSFRKIIGDDLTDQLLQIPPDLDETLGQEVEQGLTALQAGTPFTDLPPLVQWVLSNKVGAGGPLKFSTEPKVAKGAEQVLGDPTTTRLAGEAAVLGGRTKEIVLSEEESAKLSGEIAKSAGQYLADIPSDELRNEAAARIHGLTKDKDAQFAIGQQMQFEVFMEGLRQDNRAELARANNDADLQQATVRIGQQNQAALDNYVRNRALIEGGILQRKLGIDAPLETYAKYISGEPGASPEEQAQIEEIRQAYTAQDPKSRMLDLQRVKEGVRRLADDMNKDVAIAQLSLPYLNQMIAQLDKLFGLRVQARIAKKGGPLGFMRGSKIEFIIGEQVMTPAQFNTFLEGHISKTLASPTAPAESADTSSVVIPDLSDLRQPGGF